METIYQLLRSTFAKAPDAVLLAIAIAIPILFIVAVYPLIFAYTTLVERKALGRVQNRYGPNRVGRWGILQPIADGLKLMLKEDIVPRSADKLVHFLAPVMAVIPSLLLFSVVPIAPGLVPVNLNIGILFAFAVSTASVLALFMGGWASRNKFSLLGAMRAVAQVVSYEVPMVLAAVAIVMAAGSLSTLAIVKAQSHGFANIGGWFVWRPWGFVGFVLFTIGAMAESARTPFDIPEAESEIIAGYHTEYSGFKFALFQLGEYLAAIAMAGITVTMFLGGYLGPGSGPGFFGGLMSAFWFFTKLGAMILLNIWIRGTWPRVRVDQLMAFAWKVLLPMSLINIVAVGVWQYMPSRGLAWAATTLVLVLSFVILSKLNATGTIERRTYRYAS
ncbi:MAG TPA: NADH-quinone oxidoreductase subunit NuoH [Verrucomicrobiae bacterium]|nr:NADH-quinone oxidoreductase subunit NuoH [Verrucomicrobiae bacterium]